MRGWILDLYPGLPGEMVVWLKLENGRTEKLVDRWAPSMYVAADDIRDLRVPLDIVNPDLVETKIVQRFENVTDSERSEVVEARVKDAKKLQRVAGRIERLGPFGAHRLYNVDVPPQQSYLYEHDLFPLALCDVVQSGAGLGWELLDDVWAYDYDLPVLRRVKIDVDVAKEGRIARVTDKIRALTLKNTRGEKITIDGGDEADKLLELVSLVREIDPDFVLTDDGDTFLLPYLAKRAEASGIPGKVILDRASTPLRVPSKEGTSYFSYGRIHYKPSAIKLYGRLHIDANSSFTYFESGFEGLFELSRICRMPLQTASRASIGKALSSLQFYHAARTGLLVPWKPTLVERVKDRNELLMADRGGLVFEPKAGLYEGVGELDFSSLYPSIMLTKNISAETVRCPCCPDSVDRVPELGWNVCERRRGIVPLALEIVVEKKAGYKELKSRAKEEDRSRYEARQAVLKWIGVCSFGYLGYNNAKFGRIDAHIAVCAWDRKILMDATRTAEGNGFEVVHGIVDSLWLWRPGARREDYLALKSRIEQRTGFPLSFEGLYKWIAFLPSKVNAQLPVLNRYFGVYERGNKLKVRGIEARRHDTPVEFRRCQMEILNAMAQADSVAEARAMAPSCVGIFLKHAEAIERHETTAPDLAFTTNLSKAPEEYTSMTVQRAAMSQLVEEGVKLHAGEGIRYVVTDYDGKGQGRATPLDGMRDDTAYDSARYVELLAVTCASVLQPFDPRCTARGLLSILESRKTTTVG